MSQILSTCLLQKRKRYQIFPTAQNRKLALVAQNFKTSVEGQ